LSCEPTSGRLRPSTNEVEIIETTGAYYSRISAMTQPLPLPQPAPVDGKLREFDSVPLFMRSLPEDASDDIAISALQSLAHEGTPDGL
jgi:hypothetical protein